MSVSKLAQDNRIFIEFHGDFCLVKDKVTGRIVLRGVLKDGLYQLENVKTNEVKESTLRKAIKGNSGEEVVNSSVFVCDANVNAVLSRDVWHRRLGHPASKILNSVIRDCKLPVKLNEELSFYSSCQYGKSHALSFPQSLSKASSMFELIYSDL